MHRILLEIGPVTLYSYGLMVAIAFLMVTFLVMRDVKKTSLVPGAVFDCLIIMMAGGLLGGRLLFVIQNASYYLAHPLRVFFLSEGGLAMQGAVIAGGLSGFLAARIKKVPFWEAADLIAPYVALGQSIGRIGCFLNGCCYGRAVKKGLAVTFPGDVVARFPIQLFTSLVFLLVFLALMMLRKRRHFIGEIFAIYVMLDGLLRFLTDFARGDMPMLVGWMKLSQGLGISLLVCGAVFYVLLRAGKIGDRTR